MNGLGDRFADLVTRPEAAIPLDEAALLIAAHAYPHLDVAAELGRLDQLADSCPEPTFDGLRRHLFDELGFTGNGIRYDDPRNSFLNQVLDRRVGIPISLALVTMEVGRRVGVVLEGIGMPGHFLVRHLGDPPVLVDPFSGGRTLGAQGAEDLFRRVHGEGAAFRPELLAPARPRSILVRTLTNLRQLYQHAGDAASAGWVMALRATIPAGNVNELADVAGAQASLGRFTEAAATLDAIAEQLPDTRADSVRGEAKLLRSRLN